MHETLKDVIGRHAELGAAEDQQQLIALLKDAQELCGGTLTQDALDQIAAHLGVSTAILRVLARRIPSLRLSDAPHRLEICGHCGGSRALRDHIEKQYSVKSGAASEHGFMYFVTGCMKNCLRGPSVRWDGVLHDEADIPLIDRLIRDSKNQGA